MSLSRSNRDDNSDDWPRTVTFERDTEFELLLHGKSRDARRHARILNSLRQRHATLVVHAKDGDIELPLSSPHASSNDPRLPELGEALMNHARTPAAVLQDSTTRFRAVCRDEKQNIVQKFTQMTTKDVSEALESALKHLPLVMAPSTRLFFLTKDGLLSLTVETDEDDTSEEPSR